MTMAKDDRKARSKQGASANGDLTGEFSGGVSSVERIVPLAYEELTILARYHLRGEREGHTLDTTSMVHEAFLQLVKRNAAEWSDSKHFYAVASKVMRNILVDHARHRNADKRGGGVQPIALEREDGQSPDDVIDILALDEALSELANMDGRLERVVECRYFAGMSVEQTADALGASVRSIERDWTRARAYILRSLERPEA